jgi:glycosyltransferase involved in cell wall biosynthesis
LPQPGGIIQLRAIPPLVHPSFQPALSPISLASWDGEELPETYLLYHGPLDRPSLSELLSAWSWAAAALGAYYPLIIYGVPALQKPLIQHMLHESGLSDSTRLLPTADSGAAWGDPRRIAALYQGCTALFHPQTPSPWGDPLRHALACGKPVVVAAHPWVDALCGPAGISAPAGDTRRLGAALIAVCIEEDLAQQLSVAATQRARAWAPELYRQAWLSLF